jgi:hypothetical protein
MIKKGYFGIKKSDIESNIKTDFKNWEVIHIEANNYYEALKFLKQRVLYEDYYLIPKMVLEYREQVNANKFFEGVI